MAVGLRSELSTRAVPRRGRWSAGLVVAALVVVAPVVLSPARDQDRDRDGEDDVRSRDRACIRDRDDGRDANVQPGDPWVVQRVARRWWPWLVGMVVVVALVIAAPIVLSVWDVRTMSVDASAARRRLADPRTPSDQPAEAPTPSDQPAEAPTPVGASTTRQDPTPVVPARSRDDAGQPRDDVDQASGDAYQSFLVIGSDERDELVGSRADVLLMGLLPHDGSDPIMFSLPRDLWLDDPCEGGRARINDAYNGCGDTANGFELTSIVVEDFTGITVDHVVVIDFEGFEQVINAVGGVRICVDNPVREVGKLDLPGGCTMADGAQTLGWVRSRATEELFAGQWRPLPGVNDLTRNRRQQQVMLQLLGRVGSFGTLGNLHAFARGVSDSVTLGSGLSVLDGVRVVWNLRGSGDDIRRFSIPVTDHVTSEGAAVLLPTEPFATTFEREIG